jgi:hypothetical protein
MDNYVVDGPQNHEEVFFIRLFRSFANSSKTNLPVGLHWQVSQAASIQNVEFRMKAGKNTRQVGIFQENGSGGFVSNVTFNGGRWCWMAGSQQYTARNIRFRNCK